MDHQFWRLSAAGDDNLGVVVSADGLMLGRTPLIERRDGRFIVREQSVIERLLNRAYQNGFAAARLMPGLATVASALSAQDRCLAHIAAVHLRIPDLSDQAARDSMEAEDILIKSAHWNPALRSREMRKASPDDPEHPGWPAGTEGGRGGKFRPKTELEITEEIKTRIRRIAMRRALRTGALAVLRIIAEFVESFVPVIGIAGEVAMLVEMANTISEFRKLKIDADTAIDFVKHGPYNLEDLQVSSSGYEEFASYDAFVKGELSLRSAG